LIKDKFDESRIIKIRSGYIKDYSSSWKEILAYPAKEEIKAVISRRVISCGIDIKRQL
jgi:hypothetical protein